MDKDSPKDKPDEKRHWTPNPTGKGLPPGKWQHLPTKLIRVPEQFVGEILAIARALDSGEMSAESIRSMFPEPETSAKPKSSARAETLESGRVFSVGDRCTVKLRNAKEEEAIFQCAITHVYPRQGLIGVRLTIAAIAHLAERKTDIEHLAGEVKLREECVVDHFPYVPENSPS